jgi:hypothetical protein
MAFEARPTIRLESVRTLIRYVDEDQAILEVHVTLRRPLPIVPRRSPGATGGLGLLIELHSNEGFHDEHLVPLHLRHRRGTFRMQVVQPSRWWPAGMGEQPLYDLTASLLVDDAIVDQHQHTVGFTSVRPDDESQLVEQQQVLLVNGRRFEVEAIVAVDRIDENSLLPAAGDTLIMVRDHYGPDLLYEAADRAGIMLIQCVPIHPEGRPEVEVPAQVCRLASHPSLAGWFIDHHGDVSRRIAQRLRRLDPTHSLIGGTTDRSAA